jgi:hypothetical protein
VRRVVIALLSSIVVGVLLIPSSVSAEPMKTTISDRPGDLAMYDVVFGVAKASGKTISAPSWGDNAPMKKVGYLDMVSLSFGTLDDGTYEFEVIVAGDSPQAGDALPHGIKLVAWLLWIDTPPWTPGNPVPSLFEIWVQYDGTGYAAVCRNTATRALTLVPFTMGASSFQMQISPDLIGNPASFWWSAATFALTNYNTLGWMVDLNDVEKVPGQVWFDMPWPPV